MQTAALAAGLAAAAALATGALVSQQPSPRPQGQTAATRMVVYKSPSCGCCGKWVDYVRANGFQVTVIDTSDVAPIKRASGVPANAESCHTAQIGGYVIEGHVPVEDIRRLLRERPAIAGLSAPGMPASSPGMATAGARPVPYDVVTIARDGRTAVYARH